MLSTCVLFQNWFGIAYDRDSVREFDSEGKLLCRKQRVAYSLECLSQHFGGC
jgi:hypothetical protein